MPGPGVVAYIEHDGRVLTVSKAGRRTLPLLRDVAIPFRELGRIHVLGTEVVVGAAVLERHPRDWVLKDDVPALPDADPLLCASVLTSIYRPIVAVLAADAGRVLLVRPSRGVVAGHWTLPGGFLLPFEDPAEGARREMVEETGVAPGPLALLGAWLHRGLTVQFPLLGLAYGCRSTTGSIQVQKDEIAEARWFPVDDALTRASGMAAEALERWEVFARGVS